MRRSNSNVPAQAHPSLERCGSIEVMCPIHRIPTRGCVAYERLIMDVTTDGSITPKDAIMLAAKIAKSHFDFFENMSDIAEKTEVYQEKKEEENRIMDMPIETMDLSVRAYNCLRRDGYTTVRKIYTLSESQLYAIHQMGEKSG